MAPERRADGAVALITGGASGIGLAIAHELARRGCAGLALLDRDEAGLARASAALSARSGASPRVTTAALDVADADALARAFDDAVAAHGGLDFVLNNAAIMTGLPVFPAADLAKIDEVIATNLRAVLVGTQLAHGVLSERSGGAILNTASGAAKIPLPTDPVYAATKAGVVMLTRSCAAAFAEVGIRINALCPGVTDTPILEQNGNGQRPPELSDGRIPLLRAEDVALAAVELLLDDSRTGEAPSVVPLSGRS